MVTSTVLLALVTPAASAQSTDGCVERSGALTGQTAGALTVPGGCAVTFKAWGGAGGAGDEGGGGGYAQVTLTPLVTTVFNMATGGPGGQRCHPAPLGGSGAPGFSGGAGGQGLDAVSYCSGGGGGGASVVWVGQEPTQPVLVAAGGGGGGGHVDFGRPGLPGGVGPRVDGGIAGSQGSAGASGAPAGSGGGGAGYPLGGAGGTGNGGSGSGGQSYASSAGLTADGSRYAPGNVSDPERPYGAGLAGGTPGTTYGGAIVYHLHASPDVSPDPFGFAPLSGQDAGALVTSEGVVVTGFAGPLTATVVGDGAPELSVDGGPWGPASTVAAGDSLQLRQVTSVDSNEPRSAYVTVGSVTVSWRDSAGSLEGGPLITSAFDADGAATCGQAWRPGAEGRIAVASAEPVSFSVEASPGDPLPQGLAIAADTGEVRWTPATRDRGLQRFAIVARTGRGEDRRVVEVRVRCDEPLRVGCGCAWSLVDPAAGAALLLLLAFSRGVPRLATPMATSRRARARASRARRPARG